MMMHRNHASEWVRDAGCLPLEGKRTARLSVVGHFGNLLIAVALLVDDLFRAADMRGIVQDLFMKCPRKKQVLMFSATMNDGMRTVARKLMNKVCRLCSASSRCLLSMPRTALGCDHYGITLSKLALLGSMIENYQKTGVSQTFAVPALELSPCAA
jgi:hypothetical protein